MQEEVDEKVIGLCVTGGQISGEILKSALSHTLNQISKFHEKENQKQAMKKQQKNATKTKSSYKGKQSLRSLKRSGAELTNIEITNDNIKSFERYARKYNVEYSLKKDKSVTPPRYFVFFKAKDVDSMTAAFKEYTGKTMNKKKSQVSVRKALNQAIERVAKHKHRQRERNRSRGREL